RTTRGVRRSKRGAPRSPPACPATLAPRRSPARLLVPWSNQAAPARRGFGQASPATSEEALQPRRNESAGDRRPEAGYAPPSRRRRLRQDLPVPQLHDAAGAGRDVRVVGYKQNGPAFGMGRGQHVQNAAGGGAIHTS